MAKGTTTSTGLVRSYFANIFGPPQYRAIHDPLAERTFTSALAACEQASVTVNASAALLTVPSPPATTTSWPVSAPRRSTLSRSRSPAP